MNTIYLDPNQVPQSLRGSYTGKKFHAILTEEISIPSDAGLWSGGSREQYYLVEISTGRSIPTPSQGTAPWDKARHSYQGTLPEGVALVCHSMFCGKDMGLTFYVRPDAAAKLLPEKSEELSEHEKIVLSATASYKSSYNGMDRYEMAKSYAYGAQSFPTRAEWDEAKALLITKGMLNKAGAITNKGRNSR
jgi:hypothetical protein